MKILQQLKTKKYDIPPIWLMRQAGRYLPEYKTIRNSLSSFLDLCYNENLAFEVAMQPIKRFNFDAAIVFSDILVVPHALGFNLKFMPEKGPILEKISVNRIEELKNFNKSTFLKHLSATSKTISKLRSTLTNEKSVIGFAGAPWTIASYMITDKPSLDISKVKLFSLKYRQEFIDFLYIIAEFSILYLSEQIKAGADTIQIFDSWAGSLGQEDFIDFCIKPISHIVKKIKDLHPEVLIIGFPKGANNNLKLFVDETNIDVLSVDWRANFSDLQKLQEKVIIQGNLDPVILLNGGEALKYNTEKILDNLAKGRFIFNLGHGILPITPVENVKKLIELVRGYNG